MGTNFYHQRKKCETCGSTGYQKHIGKSSCGWQFHFRGYRDEELISYEQWLKELDNPEKEIVDEYDRLIPLEDFKAMVEMKKDGLNHCNVVLNCPMTKKEREYCSERPKTPIGDISERTWKDNEGHPFTDWEFC